MFALNCSVGLMINHRAHSEAKCYSIMLPLLVSICVTFSAEKLMLSEQLMGL